MSTIVDGLFLSRSPRVYKGSIMSTIADSSLSWSRCLAVCRPPRGGAAWNKNAVLLERNRTLATLHRSIRKNRNRMA